MVYPATEKHKEFAFYKAAVNNSGITLNPPTKRGLNIQNGFLYTSFFCRLFYLKILC